MARLELNVQSPESGKSDAQPTRLKSTCCATLKHALSRDACNSHWLHKTVYTSCTSRAVAQTYLCGSAKRENEGCCCCLNHLRVVALVPINARFVSEFSLQVTRNTHNVLRPAMRLCVAHDPPSTILCLPSKKSAVYPGYSGMAEKPSCFSRTVLVCHAQVRRLIFLQSDCRRTYPFPGATQIRLPTELITLVGNRNRVPMLERRVRPLQINEEAARLRIRTAVGQMLGWWRLRHAVIDQMPR